MGRVDLTIHRCERCDRLADKLEQAEETIRQLQEAMHEWWLSPAEFRMTPQQDRILATLLRLEQASYSQLMCALYSDRPGDWADEKIIHVQVYNMRRKLRPLGIKIETIIRRGYRLSADAKRRIAALVEARRQHEPDHDQLAVPAREERVMASRKLTQEQEAEISRRYGTDPRPRKEVRAALAAEFGVSASTILRTASPGSRESVNVYDRKRRAARKRAEQSA